jgi:hypothetical protein
LLDFWDCPARENHARADVRVHPVAVPDPAPAKLCNIVSTNEAPAIAERIVVERNGCRSSCVHPGILVLFGARRDGVQNVIQNEGAAHKKNA